MGVANVYAPGRPQPNPKPLPPSPPIDEGFYNDRGRQFNDDARRQIGDIATSSLLQKRQRERAQSPGIKPIRSMQPQQAQYAHFGTVRSGVGALYTRAGAAEGLKKPVPLSDRADTGPPRTPRMPPERIAQWRTIVPEPIVEHRKSGSEIRGKH